MLTVAIEAPETKAAVPAAPTVAASAPTVAAPSSTVAGNNLPTQTEADARAMTVVPVASGTRI